MLGRKSTWLRMQCSQKHMDAQQDLGSFKLLSCLGLSSAAFTSHWSILPQELLHMHESSTVADGLR